MRKFIYIFTASTVLQTNTAECWINENKRSDIPASSGRPTEKGSI